MAHFWKVLILSYKNVKRRKRSKNLRKNKLTVLKCGLQNMQYGLTGKLLKGKIKNRKFADRFSWHTKKNLILTIFGEKKILLLLVELKIHQKSK